MNPLSATQDTPLPPRNDHPAMLHARVWSAVNAMPQSEMAQKISQVEHVLPILGALAGNPNVTRKDVIKGAADAAGSGNVPPSQAVKFISGMPDDADKLQPWLKSLYAANLSGIVHMKAAMMAQAQPGAPTPMLQQGAPAQ